MNKITLRGVRTHNLKNLNLDLPRNQLIVITGLSGSGKSSLAFDTLYAEGQRRYVESLSSYARQFLSIMEKPDLDSIEGLSPAIAVEQKTTAHNPRSTVGTITEIYDYLRLLYSRVGTPYCPKHQIPLMAQTISQMVDLLLKFPENSKIMLLAPIVSARKGEYLKLLENFQAKGFLRARIDGEITKLNGPLPKLDAKKKHDIELVVDRISDLKNSKQRLAESLATTVNLTNGLAKVLISSDSNFSAGKEKVFSAKFACPHCDYSIAELEPSMFSFNNPLGACPQCNGLGVHQIFSPDKVIIDQDLSLAGGAICGWTKKTPYYFSILSSLAEHYQFELTIPFKKLPEKIKKIILYGSGKEKIAFNYILRSKTLNKKHPFEGIINNLERRYLTSESEAAKEELAKYLSIQTCNTCCGSRLKTSINHVLINETNIAGATALTIDQAIDFFANLSLSGTKKEIADKILKEIEDRLHFLSKVGLGYLSMDRPAETLSGGEAQRIRLASQLGSKLVGVMYILDEPTIGLHQRDNQKLLAALIQLKNLGNTVIMVEHDEEAILAADQVIDMGPLAGIHGGEVIFQGSTKALLKSARSLTARYLSEKQIIGADLKRVEPNLDRVITIYQAFQNNLKHIEVSIPIGLFTCITGVSGSGKSSLINEVLYPVAAKTLNRATISIPKTYREIAGLNHLNKVIAIDQSPIGRTPRSNPATYIGLFSEVRELFAATVEARARNYPPGRFSFNVPGGRCEACQGDGLIKVAMHFLPDIYVVCDVCKGNRYNRETLEVVYKGKNIAQILELTVEGAYTFFAAIPSIANKLKTLMEVGLSYIKLGQSSTTLSGGEAQRIKLAKELARRDTGSTLYLLDEPTTGLHFYDIEQLLKVLHKLRDQGNTIIVIEHNLEVIKTADWIIDLGPEGGEQGGQVVAYGTPEAIVKNPSSHTGKFLSLKLLPKAN